MTSFYEGALDIGGRALYATVRGEGPTVVLSSGGGRESVGAWDVVEGKLAGFARVVVYDRAGLGRSDPAPAPPTAADMVSDLRALMRALSLATPALLVGASLSAIMLQLYASRHPSEVSALLLLDPTPGTGLEGFERRPAALQNTIREAMLKNAAHLGMSEGGLSEIRHLPESFAQLTAALSEPPDIPVIVVTAMRPPEIPKGTRRVNIGNANLADAHKSIVARYPRGRQLFAEKSSHASIVSNEPELVVDSIRTLLDLTA